MHRQTDISHFSDKSGYRCIPEHQSHSFKKTTTAAAGTSAVTHLNLKYKILEQLDNLFLPFSCEASENTRPKHCNEER